MTDLNFGDIAEKLAGVAGALVSMRYLQGPPMARLSMAVSGSLLSYYAAPHVAQVTGLPEGLTGFLLGVFGMAIVSRVWEWVRSAPIPALWQALIDRVRGRTGGT